MAIFNRYSVSYAVEGIKFLVAPTQRMLSTNAGRAELELLQIIQAKFPDRNIRLGTVREIEQDVEHKFQHSHC